jgi:hypothetical protein
MRPITLVISAFALVGLVVLGIVSVKLSRKMATVGETPYGGVDAEDAGVAEGASAPDAGAPVHRTWAEVFAKSGGRPIPRFDDKIISGAAEKALADQERTKLKEDARKDGFLFREAGSPAVYIVQNGTKFHIQTPSELGDMGLSWDKVREVPAGSLDFLTSKPPDNSLFRERGDPHVYYFENGKKRWVTSHSAFAREGHQWGDIRVVPQGSLGSYASGPQIR